MCVRVDVRVHGAGSGLLLQLPPLEVPSPLVSGSPRAQPGLLEVSATDPGTEEVGKNI